VTRVIGSAGLLLTATAGITEAQGPSTTDSVLRDTRAGAVYHTRACEPSNQHDRLIIYVQGTGATPRQSSRFVRHVGDRTGLCVIAIPYENSKLVASYCLVGSPSSAQNPDCLTDVLGAKAASRPATVMTSSGGRLEVPFERSVEGAILTALRELRLTSFLTGGMREVKWDRLVLTGGSQGAQLSMYIALTRHRVAGVGSICGGVLKTDGARAYPPFVYESRKTDLRKFKAFHHHEDADAMRRDVYTTLGLPAANVHTTTDPSANCGRNPHSCVIIDSFLPEDSGVPIFLDEWVWVATPTG